MAQDVSFDAADNGAGSYDAEPNTAADGTNAPPEITEEDKALAKKILSNIRLDKRHHEKAFKRMRRDMGVALRGFDDSVWSPTAYAANVSGRNATRSATAFAPTGFHPWPSSIALMTWGVTRVPPLAIVVIISASDAGVTDTCP